MDSQGDAPQQQQYKEGHHRQGPDESQLLADNGEDKIVLGLRHKHVFLAAVAQAQAGGTPGTDGVEALDSLVAISQGVGKGVQPGGQPAGRIGHQVGHYRHRRPHGPYRASARQHKPFQAGTSHKHQHRADPQNQQRAGQVGFQQHQDRHRSQHQPKGQHPHRKALHPAGIQ